MKVYDCFTFYNELDLLEIRLEELGDAVDTFVIVEATVTFQGKDKPLYFEDNRHRFAKFAHKIRHVVVDHLAEIGDPWQREWAQRNAIKRGLTDAAASDAVIVSDVDEIVRASTIQNAAVLGDFCFLEMQLYAYFLNWKALPWIKPYMAPWSVIDAMPDLNAPRHEELAYLDHTGRPRSTHVIADAGWHFSWMGGVANMVGKIGAFSHTEERVQAWRDPEFLTEKISEKRFFDICELKEVEIDGTFPAYVQSRRRHLEAIGLISPTTSSARSLLSRLFRPRRARSDALRSGKG